MAQNDSAKGSDEIVTEVPKDTTVTFWHAMNGAQEEALTKLTDEFMEANPNVKVELQNQSQYPICRRKSIRHYLHQKICQPSHKRIQVGFGMQLKMKCLLI